MIHDGNHGREECAVGSGFQRCLPLSTPPADDDATPAQAGYTRLRDLIRTDIVAGRLRPGERLKIAELAARYDTSSIPVREALHGLEGEGIVTFVANRGASVRGIDANFLRDIHEVRALIEPFLFRWFVRHHAEADMAALEDLQRRYDAEVGAGDLGNTQAMNRAFHAICYDGHHNEEALRMAIRYTNLIGALADRLPRSRARCLSISREHWGIIAAIRAQDEDLAATRVMEHVRRAGQHLTEMIRASERQATVRRPQDAMR